MNHNSQGPAFSYPPLDYPEIVGVLQTLSIPVTEAELRKPTYEKMKAVYVLLLEQLTGVTREELLSPNGTLLSEFEYPEVYEDAAPEISFISTLLKLLQRVGFGSFTAYHDLYNPDPIRTKIALSAIINYIRFHSSHIDAYEVLAADVVSLNDQKQKLEASNNELLQQLNALKQQQALEEQQVMEMEKEKAEVENEIKNLDKLAGQIRAETNKIKQLNKDLAAKLQDQQFFLTTAKEENLRLKSQIVQSPEKMIKTLDDMAETLMSEKEAIVDSEKRCRDLQMKTEALTKIEKQVLKCIELMEVCEGEMKKLKNFKQQVKTGEGKINQLEQNVKELETAHQHLKQKLARAGEKLLKLQEDKENKQIEIEKAVEDAKGERVKVEKEKANNKLKIDQNNQVLRQLQNKTEELTKKHKSEVNALRERFDSLSNQIRQYHHGLNLAMSN